MADSTEAMFVPDGDGFVVATKLTQGPWDPGSQYGGCPAALLTWAAERVPTLVPMRIARITIDMHRRVPLGRVAVDAEVVREGKRLQLVLATIHDPAGVEVARATVLRMRRGSAPDAPNDPRHPEIVTPPLGPVRPPRQRTSDLSGFMDAVEVRESEHPGASTNWFRAARPVIAGEEASHRTGQLIAVSTQASAGSFALSVDSPSA